MSEETKSVLTMLLGEAYERDHKQYEQTRRYNNNCPKCEARDIINKFSWWIKVNVCEWCKNEFEHKTYTKFSGVVADCIDYLEHIQQWLREGWLELLWRNKSVSKETKDELLAMNAKDVDWHNLV